MVVGVRDFQELGGLLLGLVEGMDGGLLDGEVAEGRDFPAELSRFCICREVESPSNWRS